MASEQKDTKQPTSFLSLPLEIREEIYKEHLFPFVHDDLECSQLASFTQRASLHLYLNDPSWTPAVAIFRVSRRVGIESRRLFYLHCRFFSDDLHIAELYDFLYGIGRENRLLIQNLRLSLQRPNSFANKNIANNTLGGGYHLCRIFNILALGHNLKFLSLDFNQTTFATFLYSEKIVQEFSKLRNVGQLELNWLDGSVVWDSPTDVVWGTSRSWSPPPASTNVPIVHMSPTSMEVAAQKLIFNAQRPQYDLQVFRSEDRSFLERTQAHTEELCSLLSSRIGFITQREAALNEAEECKTKIVLAEQRASELEKMISDVEEGIARMLPDTLS